MTTTAFNYKKIAVRLKKERHVFVSRHPNGLDMLIGTSSYCFCVAPEAQAVLAHYWQADGDTEMEWNEGTWSESRPFKAETLRSFWNRMEALEVPQALLFPTRLIYESPRYQRPSDFYRKLRCGEGNESRPVWVDKGLLDVLDPDPDTLGNTHCWQIELLDHTLIRAKRCRSHFEYGKGSVVTWHTVLYCCRATNITEELP